MNNIKKLHKLVYLQRYIGEFHMQVTFLCEVKLRRIVRH